MVIEFLSQVMKIFLNCLWWQSHISKKILKTIQLYTSFFGGNLRIWIFGGNWEHVYLKANLNIKKVEINTYHTKKTVTLNTCEMMSVMMFECNIQNSKFNLWCYGVPIQYVECLGNKKINSKHFLTVK